MIKTTPKKQSWITKTFGALTVAAGLASTAPGVPPEWAAWAKGAAPVLAGLGVLFARQHGVSSKAAGVE